MIEEFDKLAITSDIVEKLTTTEKRERVKQRENLIKEMSEDEIKELLKRPYPNQFKTKIKALRK